MNELLISFLGVEYEDYIEYKDFFKKLNEKLDVVLYLCNNVSNDRIKDYIINTIECGDYYDNYSKRNWAEIISCLSVMINDTKT
jgi:hypothetical protein